MSIRESWIKKYKEPPCLKKLTELTRQEVKDAVEDKILDPAEAHPNREPIKLSGSGDYSITVKPNNPAENRDNLKKKTLDVVKPDEDTGNEEDYPILLDIKSSKKEEVRNDGISLPSNGDISNTTPVAVAKFQEIPFDKESIFNVVVGFKGNKSATGETQATEEFLAAALCCCLNRNLKFEDDINLAIEMVFDSIKIPNMSDTLFENWEKSFQKTIKELVNPENDLFDNDRYVVCREDIIYIFDEDTQTVRRETKFNGIKSIHTIINETASTTKTKRDDLFPAGFRKDSWNPSDIYVVKENIYSSFANEWNQDLRDTNKITSVTDLNLKLKMYLLNKSVIGISLKKISDSAHIEKANVDDEIFKERTDGSQWRSKTLHIIGDNLKIFTPELRLYDGIQGCSRSGLRFTVRDYSVPKGILDISNPKNLIKQRAPKIDFSYRTFTDSPSMILEPQDGTANARAGKTSTSLLSDFQTMANEEMKKEGLPPVDKNLETRGLARFLNEETKKLFSRESSDYKIKMDYILNDSGFLLYTINLNKENELINNEKWDNFVNMVIESGVIQKEMATETMRYRRLRDWVSMINFMYVLAYCNSQGTLEDDIALLYDYSHKFGSRFAPYVLVY